MLTLNRLSVCGTAASEVSPGAAPAPAHLTFDLRLNLDGARALEILRRLHHRRPR